MINYLSDSEVKSKMCETTKKIRSVQNLLGTYPKDFFYSEGIVLNDFNSITGWTGTSVTFSQDLVNKKYGDAGMRIEKASGTAQCNCALGGVDYSLASINHGLWVYFPVDPKTITDTITVYLTSTANDYSKYFSVSKSCFTARKGWNFFPILQAEWVNTGAESWSNLMQYMRINVIPKAGQIVDVTIGAWCGYLKRQSALMIDFDDGWKTAYTIGEAYARYKGIKTTHNLVGSLVGATNYMTKSMVKSLRCSCNHTKDHSDLTTLNAAQIKTKIDDNIIFFNDLGMGENMDIIAYPYGYYNDTILEIMQNYCMGRSVTANAQNIVKGRPNWKYTQDCLSLDNTVSLATAKAEIDAAKAKENICRLLLHGLDTVASAYNWVTSDYMALIDYAVASGIRIIDSAELAAQII